MYIRNEDTICAPATVPGTGAISVIRVSGPQALEIADKVIRCRKGTISSANGYTLKFGTITDDSGAVVDEVLASVFRAPHSYTGENSVEISCHASLYIVSTVMGLLHEAGARAAEPGEFTQRAYLNGKMDLAQAEAVADVIASQNAAAHRIAFKQMKGGFSSELRDMRSELLELVSLMELELDFSEEEVEFADRSRLDSLLSQIISHVSRLIDSFRLGNAIKNGVPVAIAGATNTGKSTLLNALLGEERAIVSDIAGTTRDTIEETLNISGKTFRFIDTAGIRETEDTIEKIGIERAFKKISEADIILGLLDLKQSQEKYFESARFIISNVNLLTQKLILIFNKVDLNKDAMLMDCEFILNELRPSIEKNIERNGGRMLDEYKYSITGQDCHDIRNLIKYDFISAKNDNDIEKLKKDIAFYGRDLVVGENEVLVTNLRHYEALVKAAESLVKVKEGLDFGISTEFVAQDLKEVLYYLGSITGEISSSDVLNNIFGRFCIGK